MLNTLPFFYLNTLSKIHLGSPQTGEQYTERGGRKCENILGGLQRRRLIQRRGAYTTQLRLQLGHTRELAIEIMANRRKKIVPEQQCQ